MKNTGGALCTVKAIGSSSVFRRGFAGERRQVVFAAGDSPEGNCRSDDNALVVSLALAWQWQEELESGKFSTVEELASTNKVDMGYVAPDAPPQFVGPQYRRGDSAEQRAELFQSQNSLSQCRTKLGRTTKPTPKNLTGLAYISYTLITGRQNVVN